MKMRTALTIESLGSAALNSAFKPETEIKEITSNGKTGDALVRLYQADSGQYFATTNADPIFEYELEENCLAGMKLKAYIESL